MRLGFALAAASLAVVVLCAVPHVHADGSFDSTLYADTNGDRASVCGQPSLGWSGSMASIAEQRAEYIADSGNFTNQLEMSYGAENVGWSDNVTDPVQAAHTINQAYLGSPDHKANICDPRWNVIGIGSVFRSSWQGKSNVWIDAEEFTNASSGGGGDGGSQPSPVHPASPPSMPSVPLSPWVPSTGGAG